MKAPDLEGKIKNGIQSKRMVRKEIGHKRSNHSANGSLFMVSCSCLFTNENANAEFSYEVINNTDKEIEEMIIGEFRNSDSAGATNRVFITLIGGQSRTKGAVTISKDKDKIGSEGY